MSIRTERVAKLIQREVADVLANEYVDEIPGMVTVTNVRMTKDLGIAYVHVSVFGATKAEREADFKRIDERASGIRAAVAARVRHQLRSVPELKFFLDESLQEAKRMNDLFDRIRAERARRGLED